MPNVGKPSKGCQGCRDRKIKCDLKRPSCSQCIRIQTACAGYRDQLSLMFKDESETVISKAQRSYEAPKRKAQFSKNNTKSKEPKSVLAHELGCSASAIRSNSAKRSNQHATPPQMETRLLFPSIEDQAVGFFFANYKIKPSIVPRSQFAFLDDMLVRNDTGDMVRSSVNAASIASLANRTKSNTVVKRAREEYGKALMMVNQALRDHDAAMDDRTLISVILLGMYEKFMSEGRYPFERWMKHLQGACTLLDMRGMGTFKNETGMSIFMQLYNSALLVAFQTRTKIPASMLQLWKKSTSLTNYGATGRPWSIQLINTINDAAQLCADKLSDPAYMATRALGLIGEINTLFASLPAIWRYETVHLDEPAEYVFGSSYDIYLDPWIASMWNNIRGTQLSLQLLLRSNLVKSLKSGTPVFPPNEIRRQVQISLKASRDAVAGHCATTPQLTGQVAFPEIPASTILPPPFSHSHSPPKPDCQPHPKLFDVHEEKFKVHPPGTFLTPSRPTGMENLIFPLFDAGWWCPVQPGLTEWAIGRLQFLAHHLGTRQPLVFAEDLRQKLERGLIVQYAPDNDFSDVPLDAFVEEDRTSILGSFREVG